MFLQSVGEFIGSVLSLLPSLLGRLVAAWLVTFVILVYGFHWVKPHIRPHALRVDNRVRAWAKGLRFVGEGDARRELVGRTWFFRFWTNFASAPCLCLFSLGVPLLMYCYFARAAALSSQLKLSPDPKLSYEIIHPGIVQNNFAHARLWLLPGLCYSGAMLLSYVLKRIFKRLRPPIEKGAFGHKLLRDPSFPSGHSLTSFCFWIMMAVTVALSGAALPMVVAFALLSVTIVVLTGLSRIYMGVHFPSDVVGGYTIGLTWCVICFLALRGVL